MSDTTVPAIIDALVTTFATIPGVEIHDGPRARAVNHDVIAVAVGTPSVGHQLVKATGLALKYDETLSINCSLWSWTGSKDPKPRRDRCTALIAAVRDALEPDKTLGGLCQWAALGQRFEWWQSYVGEGSACEVRFSIEVKATI